jgi:hypothetical protein
MKKFLLVGLIVTPMMFCAGAQAIGPNLVENGSFGELDGWNIYGYIWSPQTGGANGEGYIAFQRYANQSIITVPGQTYQFSFWIQSATPLIQVNWGSDNLGLFPITSGSQGWTLNQVDVTANATSTLLDFTCSNPVALCYLDDVAVNAVPEPSTLALFLSGIVSFSALCKRRF